MIFTDSKGACQILSNENKITDNFLAWEIVKKIKKATNKQITIQWIPSHMGIKGNETADQAAVAATSGCQSDFISLALVDAFNLAKYDLWEAWKTEYSKTSETKGRWYFEIIPEPGRKIWFNDSVLNSEEIIILNRIRSGHMMTKERRFNLGWEIDDWC